MKPMGPEGKDRIDKKDGTAVQKKPGKSNFLKRFFEWIAKGADESRNSGAFCPT
jgi:hypothetical protein